MTAGAILKGQASMEKVEIIEISVDGAGKLNIRPNLEQDRDFAFIYRAAMGVTWDKQKGCLLPRECKSWGHLEWFKQMVAAVADEYRKELVLTGNTRWRAVPPETRLKIEDWINESAA